MDFMQYLQQLLGQTYQQPYNPMSPRSVPFADPTGGKYTQQALSMSGPAQQSSGIRPSGPPTMMNPNNPFGGLLGGMGGVGPMGGIAQNTINQMRGGGGGMLGGGYMENVR